MSKTLRILGLLFALVLTSCGKSSEVTVSTVGGPTTTTTMAVIPPPISQTTTSTTSSILQTTTSIAAKTIVKSHHSLKVAGVWDTLSECEAHGNWALNDFYDGGLQFSPYTWTSYVAAGKPYGLVGYPRYAYQATREQQIVVAIRVRDGIKNSSNPFLNAQGYGAWPRCRHKAGV